MPLTFRREDRFLPDWGIVCWQSRRTRRALPKAGPGSVLMGGCAVLGGVAAIGQGLGVLHWAGPLAFLPAVLILGAAAAPLFAAARFGLRWLGG